MPATAAPLDHPDCRLHFQPQASSISGSVLPPPPHDDIHLWWAQPSDFAPDDLSLVAARKLPQGERDRCLRLQAPSQRHLALLTRLMVRAILSTYEPEPPWNWQFAAGGNGKPMRRNAGLIREFNLAHSDSLIVCAISRTHPVGVDIEQVTAKPGILALARRFFAAEEYRYLAALPGDLAITDFYRLWTLKEAGVKARGMGLADHLKTLAFSLEDEDPGLALRLSTPGWGSIHHLILDDIPHHAGAVAVQDGHPVRASHHFRCTPDWLGHHWQG